MYILPRVVLNQLSIRKKNCLLCNRRDQQLAMPCHNINIGGWLWVGSQYFSLDQVGKK